MADSCRWPDCRSHDVQAHAETLQCLSCGRHTNMAAQPVEWVGEPENRKWKVVTDGETLSGPA